MTPRFPAWLFALLAIVLLPTVSVVAQAPSAKTAASVVPRDPNGKPDLQGFWDFRTLTPLERPPSQADKPFLTEEEANALQRQNADRRARRSRERPEDKSADARWRRAGGWGVQRLLV